MADSAGHDQATVLEVPVTVQGAKHVEGSEQRQIFTEPTKTTIVFGNGAVVNLSSKVAQGQCVFLRNEQTGREILCKVLEWRQVAESGYADLEFTTRDPKFWDAPTPEAVVAPVAAPAAAVTVVAPRRTEALDMLPASAPAPTVAPMAVASGPASLEIHAAAAVIKPPAHHTAEELEEAQEALDESEDDAERNDTKDAELLAKLIATDPKRKPKRVAAAADATEIAGDGTAEDAPEHGETSADADGQGEARGGRRAALVAKLTPLAHKLHRFTYGKGAIRLGIAASAFLVIALGYAWHSHRSAIRSKNRASAAIAQAEQNARGATPQSTPGTAGKSGAESEAPAHGNNSGATPAQAAQKIQEQRGASSASVAVANNVTASSVPSATPSAAPKLEARESAPDADQETPEQARRRPARGPNGGETIPARIVAQPAPAIPPWAKGLDTDGVVKVDALIDEKGNLRSTKALSGPRLLQHEAERAVALWIFEPALLDGKPTATHMVLTVQFQR
jgi:Gram-negative bacterial TonB protein C-terminal